MHTIGNSYVVSTLNQKYLPFCNQIYQFEYLFFIKNSFFWKTTTTKNNQNCNNISFLTTHPYFKCHCNLWNWLLNPLERLNCTLHKIKFWLQHHAARITKPCCVNCSHISKNDMFYMLNSNWKSMLLLLLHTFFLSLYTATRL